MNKFYKLLITFGIIFGCGWFCLYCYDKVEGRDLEGVREKFKQIKLQKDILHYTVSIFPRKEKNSLMMAIYKEFPNENKRDISKLIGVRFIKEGGDPNGTSSTSN